MVESRLSKLLPQPLRELPADLATVVAIVVATNLVVFGSVIDVPVLRVPLGLAFVLFVPGYALTAALFPERAPPLTTDGNEAKAESDGTESPVRSRVKALRSGIDGLERLVLSIGLSTAIVPLFGLLLNYTPWGIRLTPVVFTVSAFALLATAVGAGRRRTLPPEERFRVPYREWYAAGRTELLEPDTRADAALNVLMVVAVVVALTTAGYAVITQPQNEQFSAMYLLTEDGEELVAGGYPTEFENGESREIIVGVDNHEQRTVEYTIVVVEQAVTIDGNETVIENQQELDRIEMELSHNETSHYRYDIEPTITSEQGRVVWLLYPDGDVPDEPTSENAEQFVQLWITISEGEGNE